MVESLNRIPEFGSGLSKYLDVLKVGWFIGPPKAEQIKFSFFCHKLPNYTLSTTDTTYLLNGAELILNERVQMQAATLGSVHT